MTALLLLSPTPLISRRLHGKREKRKRHLAGFPLGLLFLRGTRVPPLRAAPLPCPVQGTSATSMSSPAAGPEKR